MKQGDKIPEILGNDQDGKELKASDFTGKKLVLYFYPKDSTPGCTAEACSLRDNYTELLDRGYAVVGVSCDSTASHKRFIDKNTLPFSLISDPDHKLSEEMGVWGKKHVRTKVFRYSTHNVSCRRIRHYRTYLRPERSQDKNTRRSDIR